MFTGKLLLKPSSVLTLKKLDQKSNDVPSPLLFYQRFTATDYLETFADNPGDIYGASSIDNATKNCFTQTRNFVIAEYNLTEAEAWTIITQGVNFGITQVVDGNWGVHAVIPKAIFEEAEAVSCSSPAMSPTGVSSPTSSSFQNLFPQAMAFWGMFIALVIM